ncbi:hypothetical protein CUMW_215660 [Citrus unshiu]|uniref:Histone-lysine N-methyltransferase n=1 Tax=Citrus unshiu TaxID=55188 RepID=A0A2H5QBZ9_CITUN|nr:hypothetical protein CUMW_215660 [Citrus unshiu]
MGVMDSLLQTESARVVSLPNGSHSDGRLGKAPMENGHCASQGGPKHKRQKISAVRDFPPGCGPSASRINWIPNEEAIVGVLRPDAENVVVSSNHVDMLDLVGADPNGTLLLDTENVNTSGGKMYDGSKNLNMMHIGVSDEEMVLQSGSKALSSPNSRNAVPHLSNLERILTRNYPPRRRVSAIRDFPPFCGQNASVLGKEECMEAHPSFRSSPQEESDSEGKPLKETVKTDENQIRVNGYDGDACMNEFGGDVSKITSGKVLADFEEHATMETKNRDGFGTSSKNMMTVAQENTGEMSVVCPHATKRYRFDGKTGALIKSSQRDVGVLEENPVRDIVVYGEHKQLDGTRSDFSVSNNQFQEKDSEGLQLALNRVIVQGLMASLNCPWRREKGVCKPNYVSGTGQRERKKHNLLPPSKSPSEEIIKAKGSEGSYSLANSIHEQNPVRVIRGDTKALESRTYIYDGLYLVERYWQDVGSHGKLVFKFKLARIPGQPELSWKVVKKCKKSKVREGLCVDDISQGKELIPICAVNTVDDENPPSFKYTTNIIYPDWCRPVPPKGCDCTNGCSELGKCACVAKNGGELPYNHNGAIVQAKPLVYECGPSCKCPPSCYNRVSQQGIKFQLEIFKTEARGWGVRSLNSIPSGSFICEYAGELLEEKEAERRTSNDEYLFDIGNNYNDGSLWGELSNVMPEAPSSSCGVVEDGGFTIDAVEYGNVGRFVNHSCSPNLYAQNVLYDHEDKRMPHIMLFAAENIPPLQELTYHYNYVIDQVYDSSGNIKKKSCFCGSSECTGRLY